MGYINTEYITQVLNDPRVSESRLCIVSDMRSRWHGYISADGEKLFEYEGLSVEDILLLIECACKKYVDGE